MRAVVQRVLSANVKVDDELISEINQGFLVFLGVEENDTENDAEYIASKIAKLRVLEDENRKMNLNIVNKGGSVLLISQFTLLGDARGQNRPSFIKAALPKEAQRLYEKTRDKLCAFGVETKLGIFGADMKVSLVNDGPVTILIDSKKLF